MAGVQPFIARPPQTRDELWMFVKVVWGVAIPRVKVCPNHVAPFDAFANAYFAEDPVAIWKGSRGFSGKSFTLATLSLTEAVTLGVDVNILGGSGEQSTRVLQAMQRLWEYPGAPTNLLSSDPTKYRWRFKTGANVQALLASQKSVRGPHPCRLRMDEHDLMDLEIMDAALAQPMGTKGVRAQTVLASTWQYADGTFTEMKKRGMERGWPYMEWCLYETLEPNGWLPQEEVDRTKATVSERTWAIEIIGQEPSSEGRAFDPEHIDIMFKQDLGKKRGKASEYIEIESPVTEGRYATGADWAKQQDFTVIATLRTDVTPARLVAYEKFNRQPWPRMVKKLDDRLARFPGSCVHDATGIGNVIDDLIQHYAEGVVLTANRKDELISDYILAVEQNAIEAPWIESLYWDHKFASFQDVYGRGDAHHTPDSIIAMMMAWHAKKRRHRARAYILG